MTETLTNEERLAMGIDPEVRRKALRLLDAHAAREAALVAQVEAAELRANGLERSFEAAVDKLTAAQSQVADLTQERDEWHEAAIAEGRAKLRAEKALRQMSTVQEITSANLYSAENKLAAIAAETAEHDEDGGLTENECTIRDLKAQVAELTRERNEAWAEVSRVQQVGLNLESEVTRLTRERDGVRAELANDPGHDFMLSEVTRLTEALALSEQLRGEAENAATESACRVGELTEALAAAERNCVTNAETAEEYLREYKALVAQVAELTRERDEALADAERYHRIVKFDQQAVEEWRAAAEGQRDRGNALESEVTRLTEALAAAERSPKKYEVWVGTERTRERVVLETDDIEEAARAACADLSGCTFWGLKRDPYLGPPSYQKLESKLCEALRGQQAAEARVRELLASLETATATNAAQAELIRAAEAREKQ